MIKKILNSNKDGKISLKLVLTTIIILLVLSSVTIFFILKKEITYRKTLKDVFSEVAILYGQFGSLINEKNIDKRNNECADLIQIHSDLKVKITSVKVPEKHTESYSYMRDSIYDLDSGIVIICDGLKNNSTETVYKGLSITKGAETKMLKGKDVFLEE
jgi:uncharacterized protein (UPF0333 family)